MAALFARGMRRSVSAKNARLIFSLLFMSGGFDILQKKLEPIGRVTGVS
jgi:hypothetical protein